MASNLPWIEKYRPTTFDELISNGEIISTIDKLIEYKNLPHLLFYGPPGTGKTSTILVCVKKLYGDKYRSMILELNASDDRGINTIREKVKTFANTKSLFNNNNNFRLIILDEADAMTKDAQFALRQIIEKFSKNTRFCLICNYVSKIIPALQSRCTKFRFAPLKNKEITNKLTTIIKNEKINITKDAINTIINLSNGDMRKILNILQSISFSEKKINTEIVYTHIGLPTIDETNLIIDKLLNSKLLDSLDYIRNIKYDKGYSLNDIIVSIIKNIKNISLSDIKYCYILANLANIEYYLISGADEDIQLCMLVSVFTKLKEL